MSKRKSNISGFIFILLLSMAILGGYLIYQSGTNEANAAKPNAFSPSADSGNANKPAEPAKLEVEPKKENYPKVDLNKDQNPDPEIKKGSNPTGNDGQKSVNTENRQEPSENNGDSGSTNQPKPKSVSSQPSNQDDQPSNPKVQENAEPPAQPPKSEVQGNAEPGIQSHSSKPENSNQNPHSDAQKYKSSNNNNDPLPDFNKSERLYFFITNENEDVVRNTLYSVTTEGQDLKLQWNIGSDKHFYHLIHSPVAGKVAFSSRSRNGEIRGYIQNDNDTAFDAKHKLERPAQISFSPDGERIVYTDVSGNKNRLIVADIDGSNPKLIGEPEGASFVRSRIAFDSKSVLLMWNEGNASTTFKLMNLDGSITDLLSKPGSWKDFIASPKESKFCTYTLTEEEVTMLRFDWNTKMEEKLTFKLPVPVDSNLHIFDLMHWSAEDGSIYFSLINEEKSEIAIYKADFGNEKISLIFEKLQN